jgi:hypothetical protein
VLIEFCTIGSSHKIQFDERPGTEFGASIAPSLVNMCQRTPKGRRGVAQYGRSRRRAASDARGGLNKVGELGLQKSPLNDVIDQLTPGGCPTLTDVEDPFLGLLDQLVETLKISIAALENLFLDALRVAGDLVVRIKLWLRTATPPRGI